MDNKNGICVINAFIGAIFDQSAFNISGHSHINQANRNDGNILLMNTLIHSSKFKNTNTNC